MCHHKKTKNSKKKLVSYTYSYQKYSFQILYSTRSNFKVEVCSVRMSQILFCYSRFDWASKMANISVIYRNMIYILRKFGKRIFSPVEPKQLKSIFVWLQEIRMTKWENLNCSWIMDFFDVQWNFQLVFIIQAASHSFRHCSIAYLGKMFIFFQEFTCREVHEYSGDWILYFTTNAELEKFIFTFENLWQYSSDNVRYFFSIPIIFFP